MRVLGYGINRSTISDSPVRRPQSDRRKAFLPIFALPLVSCAANLFNGSSPQTVRQAVAAQRSPGENKPRDCSLSISDDGSVATLNYRSDGRERSAELELHERARLSKPFLLSCQDDRTVVVTGDFVVRAIGYDGVTNDRGMIGQLADGSFFYQNVVVLPLSPLGEVVPEQSTISGSIVIISTTINGRYRIDIDRPTQPAMPLEERIAVVEGF